MNTLPLSELLRATVNDLQCPTKGPASPESIADETKRSQ